VVELFHQVVQWQAALSESCYETAKSYETARDTLYALQVLDRPHVCVAEIFLGLGFNAAFQHDKAEEHAPRNPENTLLEVKLHPVLSHLCEYLREVWD
jgi:hypothetical protein